MSHHDELPIPGFHLDPKLVKRFVADELDEHRQAELADQVATVIMFHAVLPNALAVLMTRIVKHLGSEAALLRWLDRFAGRPKIVARLFAMIDLLDTISAQPAVVTALSELRADTPYPPGLSSYLSPDTDDETLGGLAWHIEQLAADNRIADAARLAMDSATLVERIAPRARALDRHLPDLAELAANASTAVGQAAGEAAHLAE
jgi:hypothetical protein